MVINNEYIIPKKIERLVEIVHELKDEYKIPTYEEFMKDYKVDEKVNYADLKGDDLGDGKGYGPCGYYRCSQSSSVKFKLTVRGINENLWGGTSLDMGSGCFRDIAFDVEEARRMIDKIDERRGNWQDDIGGGGWGNLVSFLSPGDRVRVITRQIRDKLIDLIREAIRKHENGQYVDGIITVRENWGGALIWRTDY